LAWLSRFGSISEVKKLRSIRYETMARVLKRQSAPKVVE
jgi:hypothetical protein